MVIASNAQFSAVVEVKPQTLSREEKDRQFEAMSKAMIEEEGLLNHAQAALLLDISARRIAELVSLGKLSRFDFLGRTYVSARELRARYKMELKAGRPKRALVERVKASVKAAVKTDILQARQGGYAGPYHKNKAKRKK